MIGTIQGRMNVVFPQEYWYVPTVVARRGSRIDSVKHLPIRDVLTSNLEEANAKLQRLGYKPSVENSDRFSSPPYVASKREAGRKLAESMIMGHLRAADLRRLMPTETELVSAGMPEADGAFEPEFSRRDGQR